MKNKMNYREKIGEEEKEEKEKKKKNKEGRSTPLSLKHLEHLKLFISISIHGELKSSLLIFLKSSPNPNS